MEQTAPHTPHINGTKKKSAFRDLVEALVIAFVIAWVVKSFIGAPFVVVGDSMKTTFLNGEYLLIDKLVYRMHAPNRGDVIVFKPPFSESTYFIKRVIGLPGETIHVDANDITIKNASHPEGFSIKQPFVSSERPGFYDVTLKDDEYFVMGDNRSVSDDSRNWGPLKKDRISGRVDLRLFPLPKLSVMPGKADLEN